MSIEGSSSLQDQSKLLPSDIEPWLYGQIGGQYCVNHFIESLPGNVFGIVWEALIQGQKLQNTRYPFNPSGSSPIVLNSQKDPQGGWPRFPPWFLFAAPHPGMISPQ